jgi:hypothetical protein
MFVSLELGAMCHVMMCVIVIVEFWRRRQRKVQVSPSVGAAFGLLKI